MQAIQGLLKELKEHSDPVRAEHDAKYHKSYRKHLGVKTPVLDKILKNYFFKLNEGELLELAGELWRTDIWDAMMAAARIIAHKNVGPSHRMWLMIKHWMQEVDGWALEDTIARGAWKCIRVNPEILDTLEKWTDSASFWYRRAALVFTLPFAKPGMQPGRMLGWMEKYARDEEWFIQKAIGWWLRDLGEHNPEQVIAFLNKNWGKLQTVARKEATRKLEKIWLRKINALI